jgi:hypothetical protein
MRILQVTTLLHFAELFVELPSDKDIINLFFIPFNLAQDCRRDNNENGKKELIKQFPQ